MKKTIISVIWIFFSILYNKVFAEDILKIAVIGPKTGPFFDYGNMEFAGVKKAVEDINNQGGVNGKKIKTYIYDDACDPKQATFIAHRIVNEKINLVVGHVCSGSTQAASKIYSNNNIIMVTPASTNPEITNKGYRFVFRTIGLDTVQGKTAAQYISRTIKPKKIAIIHDQQQYGRGIAAEVKRYLELENSYVYVYQSITHGTKDFSQLIKRLKKQKIDFVYYGGYYPELGLIMKQSHQNNFTPIFMGPEGVGNNSISKIAGKASKDLLVTLPKDFEKDPKNKKIISELIKSDQYVSGPFVLTSYSAVSILAESMRNVGVGDTKKIADYIRKTNFDTPIGHISFDEKGDLKSFQFVVYRWHNDGTKTPLN